MNLQPFLVALAAELQVEPAALDDAYELTWESLQVLVVITLLNQHYGLVLEVDDLMQCKNVGDLCGIVRGNRRAA